MIKGQTMFKKTVKFTTNSGYEIQPEKKIIKLKGNEKKLNTIYFEMMELIRVDKDAREYDFGQAIIKPGQYNGWALNKEWRIK